MTGLNQKSSIMQCTIETKDPAVLQLLQPLIAFAQKYEGHINRSYVDGKYITQDIQHKDTITKELTKINEQCPQPFVIGRGAGHVYVALHTASFISNQQPVAINGMTDRVLLITDNTETYYN
jgi:hypothetical protein